MQESVFEYFKIFGLLPRGSIVQLNYFLYEQYHYTRGDLRICTITTRFFLLHSCFYF